MKRKRDWADKRALRLCEIHTVSSMGNPCPSCTTLAGALRRAEKRGYERGHSEGLDLGGRITRRAMKVGA